MKFLCNITFYLVLTIFVASQATITKLEKIPPVIFVPGDGGSQLEAKLNKTSTVHYYCDKTTKDFFVLWLDVEWLLPLAIDCWVDNIKLNYNESTKATSNQPGVETRVPGFGDPKRVEYLDPSKLAITGDYFKYIGDVLGKLGYVGGINLHGAPFDFRKGPSELGDFFKNLSSLIETTYEQNGKERVVLIAHSMGGPLSVIFLNSKPQSWKDKYIKSLISLSGAYGGSVKALKVYATGDDLGVYLLNESVLKQVQVTMPSSAFLMPHEVLWADEVLVETPSKNYSLKNLEEFFNDVQFPFGWNMYQNERAFNKDFRSPGVELHCLYGSGVSTIKKLVYKSNKFPDDPLFELEDGDGTVNIRSLESCKQWIKQQKEAIHVQGFEGAEHMGILKDKRILDYITQYIIGSPSISPRIF